MTDFSVKLLDETTWPDFAQLVERHNGIYGGCWCMAYRLSGSREPLPSGMTRAQANRVRLKALVESLET